MKVNRNLLKKMIVETLRESDDLSPDSPYEKIISQMYSGDIDYARSAMNVYEQLKDMDVFSRHEMEEIEERWEYLQIQDIIKNDPEPILALQKRGYDFHKVFENSFGVFPPEQEFKYNSGTGWLEMILGQTTLGIDIGSEGNLEPFIYAEVEVGPGLVDQMGFYPLWSVTTDYVDPSGFMEVKHDIYDLTDERYVDEELEDAVSVSKLPEILGAWPELKLSSRWPQLGASVNESKRKLNGSYLLEVISEVLREEEEDPIDLLKSKLATTIETKDWEFFVQFFDFIDTFESGGLISKKEANDLRLPMWDTVLGYSGMYNKDNFDSIVEEFENQPNLPKEVKKDITHSIYYFGSFEMGEEWALNYILKKFGAKLEVYDPDNLYEISGVNQETLEKIKERLIEFGEEEEEFEWYPETGGLMFGELARPYVNFEKKIEEIFGAKPSGDLMLGGGPYKTIAIKKSINEPFSAPMVKGGQVTADVMFEWGPHQEYGMEITIWPPRLGTTPQTLLQDYYGIWVSEAQDGPNIGKLEIGIQNDEDEFADHKQVQNKNGTYGFTVDEMKDKIKEMTGIDLNEIN